MPWRYSSKTITPKQETLVPSWEQMLEGDLEGELGCRNDTDFQEGASSLEVATLNCAMLLNARDMETRLGEVEARVAALEQSESTKHVPFGKFKDNLLRVRKDCAK